MKKLFKFRYPKLTLLALSIAAAYFLFSLDVVREFMNSLGVAGYVGVFIAGFLFSFGFTTPFAIGALITMQPQNIFLYSLIGGFGGMLADLVIFGMIRFSFMDEFKKFIKIKSARKISSLKPTLSKKIKYYLLYVFAGIVIASPFPDEVGVSMLAGLGHIKPTSLIFISFILHTLGVFVILNL
ncbi:MAG: hypothetical protein AABX84_01660 [Nanoarchaeota archaeon]